jgi:hypothetical protein
VQVLNEPDKKITSHETKHVPTHRENYLCCYLQQEVHLQAIPTERTQALVNDLHPHSKFSIRNSAISNEITKSHASSNYSSLLFF